MRGHLKERSPGCWAIVLDARDPEGKRRRKWHSFKGTKREAQVECARLVGEHKTGRVNLVHRKLTVGEFLARWLDHMSSQLSPRSHERYSGIVTKNIIPSIGNVALAKLQPAAISQAYAKALDSGRCDGQGGLSAATVVYAHRILRHALAQAVRWGLLGRNPVDMVDPPKVERRQMNALDSDSTANLIEAARDSTLFIPILLAVLCGLRRGELAALRWRAIELDHGQLSVAASVEQLDTGKLREKPPKSGKGRSVELSSLVVEELRRHRRQQAEHLLRLGIRLTDDHHVVMREDGQPIRPSSLTRGFRRFLKEHKMQHVRLHDLRHTHATLLLKDGVHPKIAQERLGHSSIAITLDLYSHVLPGMQRGAADLLDQNMRAALERAGNKSRK